MLRQERLKGCPMGEQEPEGSVQMGGIHGTEDEEGELKRPAAGAKDN